MKEKRLRSTDIYQDTTVEILTGEKSDQIVENGMVFFERPLTDKVLKAIFDYNSGIPINVLQFVQTFKRRRAEMMTKRNTGDRYEYTPQ